MKYCPNCGNPVSNVDRYCPDCGASLEEKETFASSPIIDAGNIKSRSIPVCIILSIITFGIYFIYWKYKLNTEVNYLSGDEKAPSSLIVFILTVITFGLYSIYWSYKIGERTDVIQGKNRSYSVIFLILQIVGLPIISLILMQDTINHTLEVISI